MSDLPEPLTPADCDLRGLEWMPLYGDRMFTSDTWLLASAEGKVAALALWWAAFKQVPAGSVPDNDRILAQLAGYGVAVKAWQAIREEAMRGWVRCSDGRLYHRVVAELALEAMARRQEMEVARERHAAKMKKWRDAKGGGTDTVTPEVSDQPRDASRDGPRDGHVPSLTGQDRTRQDNLRKNPLTPTADAAGGPDRSSISEGQAPRGTRASGTNPRAIAAAEAKAKPPPPEPDSPLWPTFRARRMPIVDFQRWIGPLSIGEVHDGRATVGAPNRFHADHVRREYGPALEAAIGARVDLVAVGAAA